MTPRPIRSIPALLTTAFLTAAAPPAAAQNALTQARAFETALVQAIEKAERSVVSIAVIESSPEREALGQRAFDPFPDRPGAEDSEFIPTQFGSGVIIGGDEASPQRDILTMGHVLFGERTFAQPAQPPPNAVETSRIMVRLASRHLLQAKIVAADPRSDLAVIRINLDEAAVPREAAAPIELGDASQIRKGQIVVTLGNPYAAARDGSPAASIGIVSNIHRKPAPPDGIRVSANEPQITLHHYGTLLQLDTRLDLGTSGGAAIDLDGRMIGLTASLAALEGYEQSAGYAIALDEGTRRMIESLRAGHEVNFGFLGVQPRTANQQLLAGLRDLTDQATAARVLTTAVNSPAQRGGIREGDIILAVNGVPVYSDFDLVREVSLLGAGSEATFDLIRPGLQRRITLTCQLGKWPVHDESRIIATRPRYPAWRGLHIDYATARERYLGSNVLSAFPRGVVVTAVDENSPAERLGFGEATFIIRVNNREIDTPEQFITAVQALEGDVRLTLLDGRTVTLPAQ